MAFQHRPERRKETTTAAGNTEALTATRGNQSQAADYLDTSMRILGYKIRRYGIKPRQYRAK